MQDLTTQFFDALCLHETPAVFLPGTPETMLRTTVDASGWYDWQPIPGTLQSEDYKSLEREFGAVLPDSFIEWHMRYFFADADCWLVRLPNSLPQDPLAAVRSNLNIGYSEDLIAAGLIPFADDGNDAGSLVFDTRGQNGRADFPILEYDHEYPDVLDGLSGVIFSSFNKLLECMTHFLKETRTRKRFDVIPAFFDIDPAGAGAEGRYYWENWIDMERMNYEESGD